LGLEHGVEYGMADLLDENVICYENHSYIQKVSNLKKGLFANTMNSLEFLKESSDPSY